jgi:hypothetical protein
MGSNEDAIFKTLLYSNLFDYPLQEGEIYNFLIAKKVTQNEISKILGSNKLPIKHSHGFYFLKDKRGLVQERQVREELSLAKLKIAKKIINKLSLIPTINFIGISGTLAMKNCEKDDDIDIFVIAEKNLAWTTRLLTVLRLISLGVYRNKYSKNFRDKICLNLVLDEKRMSFSGRDLFTAHEIMQLLPVFERDGAYRKFINSNQWTKQFLPNCVVNNNVVFRKQRNNFDRLFIFICKILFLEKILKSLQLFYMRRSITREKLENGFIGLHPFDYKSYVLKKYRAEISKFKLT